jgi:hypothetical protein
MYSIPAFTSVLYKIYNRFPSARVCTRLWCFMKYYMRIRVDESWLGIFMLIAKNSREVPSKFEPAQTSLMCLRENLWFKKGEVKIWGERVYKPILSFHCASKWRVLSWKFRELKSLLSISPRFAEKLTRVGWIISVFTWLFLSHLISRLGGTKLCKHGIFEIFFVVMKQTARCITILVVFSNCAVEYHI